MRVGSSDNLALWINHPAVTAIMAAVAIAADAIASRHIRLILNRAGRQQCLCIDSLEVRKKPGGHWIIRDLMGLDLVGLASL